MFCIIWHLLFYFLQYCSNTLWLSLTLFLFPFLLYYPYSCLLLLFILLLLLLLLILSTILHCLRCLVKCLGYTSDTLNFIKHWSQFADDTAIITTLESENQYLLNLFTKWCSWSDLIIKISTYMTFGIKKSSTAAVRLEPHLMMSS